jgi:hypothetical protein
VLCCLPVVSPKSDSSVTPYPSFKAWRNGRHLTQFLIIRLPELVGSASTFLMEPGHHCTQTLSRELVGSILANAFFNTIPSQFTHPSHASKRFALVCPTKPLQVDFKDILCQRETLSTPSLYYKLLYYPLRGWVFRNPHRFGAESMFSRVVELTKLRYLTRNRELLLLTGPTVKNQFCL